MPDRNAGMEISGLRAEQLTPEPPSNASTTRPIAPTPANSAEPAESPFARALRNLGHEIDLGEAQVASASQYRNYDTSTLIALQVGIYRYTEAVDLASKIVDRASNAIRTVLQGSGH